MARSCEAQQCYPEYDDAQTSCPANVGVTSSFSHHYLLTSLPMFSKSQFLECMNEMREQRQQLLALLYQDTGEARIAVNHEPYFLPRDR